jgi:hypothetical protein
MAPALAQTNWLIAVAFGKLAGQTRTSQAVPGVSAEFLAQIGQQRQSKKRMLFSKCNQLNRLR